ncbi:MAG TPA: hypothetical protein VIF09_18570, partial [Polyangiaceae bacterium]
MAERADHEALDPKGGVVLQEEREAPEYGVAPERLRAAGACSPALPGRVFLAEPGQEPIATWDEQTPAASHTCAASTSI